MAEQKSGIDKILIRILLWIPSLLIVLFYIPNGLDKLINHDQTGKIVESSTVMIFTGIFILIGVALFLYRKTILIGTSMLVLYMTFTVLIHMYKGKPAEIAILIVLATVFSSFIREPKLFQEKAPEQRNK
ncbi:hypothetical protein [Algoriphagus halophilus]|uniref:DoxX-like family protein n=1 Tax=Algoriphagus halophilus TaxID=226505 RepID=A0A1N6DRZ8_9BACT|nr:hypothetical protein [Algoriphagus halophilus]SIN73578.1 hypothetical protein SAMN05444394_1323 [Algoriphagus halophilus]